MSIEKIKDLVKLTDILTDYMEKDSFLTAENHNLDKLNNVKEKLENRKFTVSIIAAMKAGKSTTFNALIGRDLLPNERAACTASITEIKHSKVPSDYILKKYTDGTSDRIIAHSGMTLEESFHADVRTSRKADGIKGIEKYYVESPIKALEGTGYEDLIQNFVLVDTPGPNEANIGDFDVTILQRLALEQLRNSDALIMLLDYESYKSDTNAKILKDIFENRDDLENEQGKVYFLLNKIDSMGSKDGTVEDVLNSVKQLIREYAPVIKEPKVYGFSGKQAMLSRAVLNGTATDDMKKQMELDYGSRFSIIIEQGGQEFRAVPKAENFAVDLLNSSRIEIIEHDIITEIFSNASVDMISGSTNKIQIVTDYILALAQSKIIALNKSSEELYGIVEESKSNLTNLRTRGKGIEKSASDELSKLESSINNNLNNLERKVADVLDMQIPNNDYIEHTDKEVIQQQIDSIKLNCLNAVKACLVSEVDKIQRECIVAQSNLNNKINIEFNELVREAMKSANEKINFTAKAFDINDAMYIDGNSTIESEELSDGVIEELKFNGVGATVGMGGGAAIGAAVGSVVPIIGTAIGAVVGGLFGLFAGSSKKSVTEKTKTVYKASLLELKDGIINSATSSVEITREDLRDSIIAFANNYNILISNEIGKFINTLDKDLEKVISDYEKEKENKDAEIAHMAEIKLDMGQVLQVLEQLKN